MSTKDISGIKKYKSLGHFALEVLSLPSSNADAERLFSKYNLIKRKERNSLHLGTVQTLIHVSEFAMPTSNDNVGCFEPDREMLMYMSNC